MSQAKGMMADKYVEIHVYSSLSQHTCTCWSRRIVISITSTLNSRCSRQRVSSVARESQHGSKPASWVTTDLSICRCRGPIATVCKSRSSLLNFQKRKHISEHPEKDRKGIVEKRFALSGASPVSDSDWSSPWEDKTFLDCSFPVFLWMFWIFQRIENV